METGLDLDVIKRLLEEQAWEEVEPGREARSIFLGTIFSLTPSGKFYTPWANSNVLLCPVCLGVAKIGGHRKYRVRKRAEVRLEQMTKVAIARWGRGSDKVRQDYQRRKRCMRFLPRTCPHCDGIGSREAYLDELWRNKVEEELGRLDAYLISGEGDPCDLFVEQSRDKEEE